jgi:DNA-binding CsgD family transcriptional regulator
MPAVLACLRKIYAQRELDSFASGMVSALDGVIPSDMTGYRELEASGRTLQVFTDLPKAASDAFESGVRAHIHEHPVLIHYLRTGDGRARRVSDFLSLPRFRDLGLYQDAFRPVGANYQMITYVRPATTTVALALMRHRRDFSEHDRSVMNLLRPHLAQAYLNAKALHDLRVQTHAFGLALTGLRAGMVVLTPQRRVALMNAAARRWLAEYFRDGPGRAGGLPETLDRWIRREQASWRDSSDIPAVRRPLVLERDDKRLVIRLIEAEGRSVLILREELLGLRLEHLMRLGISRREAEVLLWLARGKTNADIAAILGLSPLTVRTHLERIYRKLGVETRTAAAARAYAVARLPS